MSADTGAALASAAPAPAAMVGPAAPGNVTVARGDTLFAIAQRVYGDGEMWPALCAANPALKAAGCDTIVAGQNLLVPPADYAQTVNRTQVGVTAAAASVAPQAPAYGPVAKPATYTAPNVGHYATPEGGSWGLVVVGSETK